MSDRPTLESETARVTAAAERYGIKLVDVPYGDDTPSIVHPAARLFAGFVRQLAPMGVDPMPLLADARHGATLAALERFSSAVALRLADPGDVDAAAMVDANVIDAADVELDALRRVEVALAELVDELKSARAKASLVHAGPGDLRELARRAAHNGGKR